MNKIPFYFLILFPFLTYSQVGLNKIVIDTVEFHYKIKNIADITSFVPQIESRINSVAQKRINEDLKTYFQATSIKQDSATYVKKLLSDFGVENLNEYFEIIKEQKQFNPNYKLGNPYYYGDELEESFNIEYLSKNLLNVTISSQILPYKGQYQFFFKSAFYDLRTGNKLEFNDFFKIPSDSLIKIFNTKGYEFGWDNETLSTTKEKLKEQVWIDNICPVFYFNIIDSEIWLMIKTLCTGPQLLDFGIPLSELKPYIEYFEFKNKLNLWGKDIESLIGQDYSQLGNKIVFEDYSIKHIGDYLLNKDNYDTDFGIAEYRSSEKRFLLFIKFGDSEKTITDVLEIDKKYLKNKKLAEYCSTKNGINSEIIAIVKDTDSEFYTEIVKAWKANRTTEKFEKMNKKKIKRCQNTNFGL